MNAHPDYADHISNAAQAIINYGKNKNNVMASMEIIQGAISEKNTENVLVGKFFVEGNVDGEKVRKSARDLAAAIMIHSSWNTKSNKKIIFNNINILEG
jgi:hypothetical protein